MELDVFKHLHSLLELSVKDELAKKQFLALFIDSESDTYNRVIDDLEASFSDSKMTVADIRRKLSEMRLSYSEVRKYRNEVKKEFADPENPFASALTNSNEKRGRLRNVIRIVQDEEV